MAEYPQREYIVRETEYPLGYTKNEEVCELVRCKDCKHHHYQRDIPYCDRIDYGYGWQDNDFCSRGERKDGDGDMESCY